MLKRVVDFPEEEGGLQLLDDARPDLRGTQSESTLEGFAGIDIPCGSRLPCPLERARSGKEG